MHNTSHQTERKDYLSNLQNDVAKERHSEDINNSFFYIAKGLKILWLIGFMIWLYVVYSIEANADVNWFPFYDISALDVRDAMVFVFFGGIGLIFLGVLTFYFLRFCYNLLMESVKRVLPLKWNVFIKPILYMCVLAVAFVYAEEIKRTGLSVYDDVEILLEKSFDNQRDNNSVLIELRKTNLNIPQQ